MAPGVVMRACAPDCKWRLISNTANKGRTKLGYANWCDFYPDNDFEKLYFIEVDYNTQSAHFNHFKNEKYSPDKVLRTSSETTKLLKQIRTLLEETAWTIFNTMNKPGTANNDGNYARSKLNRVVVWDYLTDRISCSDQIPPLSQFVEQHLASVAR